MAEKQTVVVVGATGEMGRAIVERLLIAQYYVVAVARSQAQLATLAQEMSAVSDDRFIPCVADISQDSAEEKIRSLLDSPVRGVIHGPGVQTAGGVLSAPTEAIVDAVNIKVAGMMRLVRAVDSQLQKHSRLIAIGGHYGFEPTAYASTAGVANAALSNLIRQYSWAMGDRGITAHLLAPGPADTPRLHRVAAARAERDGSSVEAVLNAMKDESAINAFTTVEQIAWAVEVLLQKEADALAGSTLFMDAGRRRGLP